MRDGDGLKNVMLMPFISQVSKLAVGYLLVQIQQLVSPAGRK